MKKYLTILLIAFSTFTLSACSDKLDKADVVVFTQAGCPYCDEALEFINGTLAPKYPDMKISVLDIADSKNVVMLMRFMKKYKIQEGSVGTPLIFFGERHFVGWSSENKNLLNRLVREKFKRR